MKHIITAPLFVLICQIFLHFPAPEIEKHAESVKVERPAEIWIMRSVLDKKPRMISIALNKKLYVAYNTQTATLYKAWFGKINFDGSVFNGVHGFQPTSQGLTFLQESDENPWEISFKQQKIKPVIAYRGHRVLKNQITLLYDLTFGDQKISMQETPEYFKDEADSSKVGFERRYKMNGAPEGLILSRSIKTASGKTVHDSTVVLKTNGITLLADTFFAPAFLADEKASMRTDKDEALALMDKNSCYSCHNKDLKTVGPSFSEISAKYRKTAEEFTTRLALKVINGGAGNWGSIPMSPHPDLSLRDATTLVSYILSVEPKVAAKKAPLPKTKPINTDTISGDRFPLKFVHPSFDLSQARPKAFKPRVGGMDFLPDGRMVVCTWDSVGSVYVLDGVAGNNPESIKVKRIATGLAEPLGLKIVDNEIYVMQKQELTKLIDLDNDGMIDEYQTVCNSWKVSDNFHEFAFGLVYRDGYFYGTLATDINNGGTSSRPQVPDRGKVVKISKKDGAMQFIATGLRTPNGIGFGVDNELFIADNQGDWLPANKIVHLQEGAWYGSRAVDFEGTTGIEPTPPVVWLQQGEIANSPSQPVPINIGPFKNQMIFGDVSYGGLQRVFAEKIDNQYQGAVFRFTQGLEAGINRLVWGPDGSLYTGGVGLNWSWGQQWKLLYGLQRLTFNGKSTFEILAVRARHNGLEIELTEPLKAGSGTRASDYEINQWWYKPTENYGGPKMDEENITIKNIQISTDRKRVMLTLANMKPKHVLYIRLNRSTITSEKGSTLWSTEAWYTLNKIPAVKKQL